MHTGRDPGRSKDLHGRHNEDKRIMMNDDIKWLIGVEVSAIVAFIGILFVVFRNLSSKLTSSTAELHKKIDDVKEKYVRRDDLDSHIQRLDLSVNDLRREQKELRDEQRTQHHQVLEAIAVAAGKK